MLRRCLLPLMLCGALVAGPAAAARSSKVAPTASTGAITFRMEPEWGYGYRPSLGISWESLSPPIKRITVTVTPSNGGRAARVIGGPNAAIKIPPGLDPLVAHTITAVVEFTGLTPAKTTVHPLPAVKAGPRPVLQDPPIPSGARLSGGRPNPCLPIQWRYNPDRAIFDALPALHDTIAAISAANGITYVYDGTTPDYHWVKTMDTRVVTSRSIPRDFLLVQWENLLRPTAGLSDQVIAFAGPGISRGVAGMSDSFATGATLTLRDLPEAHDPVILRSTLLHELGHTAGLAHVNDPTSIMTERYTGVDDFGPLDIAALNAIGKPGSGGCVG